MMTRIREKRKKKVCKFDLEPGPRRCHISGMTHREDNRSNPIQKAALILAAAWSLSIAAGSLLAEDAPFRPPAVPLVTFDPYLSIWSEADHLTDDLTRHWTHRPHPLNSIIRVDGAPSRLMGPEPSTVPAMPQTSLEVTPTRSIYRFQDSKVRVTMTFMTPALPDDLEVFSWPLSYIIWSVESIDGASHDVTIFDSTSSAISVNKPDEDVVWGRDKATGVTSKLTGGGMTILHAGTAAQPILGSSGDNHRIDWGYVYAAARARQSSSAIGDLDTMIASFLRASEIPGQADSRLPRAANSEQPVLGFVFHLGEVKTKPVTRQVIVACDEIYAIKYFGVDLRPYWRRNGATIENVLRQADKEFSKIEKRCIEFDRELSADLTRAGGARYAKLCALAYRECVAGCGLAADQNKQPLFFTKENTSNGDIATVDVFYPMDPIWVLLSPTLTKATLVPIFSYAASWHWKFPNAPHDLGTYPLAPGRDDGGEGMPVEESGNMILLADAVCQADGNPNFVNPWWPQLTQWAKYLEQYGLDPENQLCTDDFMGHLAHNANLSVKAILALAAYGDMARRRGDAATAERYFQLAKTDAQHWIQAASDGDHSRLAFDKPNTWSQKYNLVWDRILGLNVFPPDVARAEVGYYKKMMQTYGLPLDSRTKLTKTDWCFWSATLSENDADFQGFISPIYDYMDKTTHRVPLVDSFFTTELGAGRPDFHARPVVGGLYIKMLADRATWKKWADRDHTKLGEWAPLPGKPQ